MSLENKDEVFFTLFFADTNEKMFHKSKKKKNNIKINY